MHFKFSEEKKDAKGCIDATSVAINSKEELSVNEQLCIVDIYAPFSYIQYVLLRGSPYDN